ncbi:sorting nexin-13-like isoform X1 [Bradysia coprophila]|uniref:sorting nexin-13-like isoform X1 n=1 Tax=Bradysia coprophila TaxID=38358 RepID=UPI00187D7061|nr:sorting nexin-13-like isoform X1 [Bradysia coprophila]
MELKYASYSAVLLCLLINAFGLFWFCVTVLSLIGFLLGILSVVYLHHGNVDEFLQKNTQDNPLDDIKPLGLHLGFDKKTVVLINPNIKIQTESLSAKKSHDHRKKSLIDSGLDLLFKKHPKSVKDGLSPSPSAHSKQLANSEIKFQPDVVLDSKEQPHHPDKRWKPFDSIKIYTDKIKGHDDHHKGNISIGEECGYPVISVPTIVVKQPQFNDANLLDEHGSPKRKVKAMLSGNKSVDQLLHTIIDYILRDYIDSWFCSLSDNKEFSEFRTRNCIEESVQNICHRIKTVQWVPLITTKLIENVATHSRLYRLASQAVTNSEHKNNKSNQSPQRRTAKKEQHRRNKSDTDLSWYLSNVSMHKNVANSKFYTDHVDEKSLVDPEVKLLHAFFSICDTFRDECLDDEALEKYLTQVTETILYFTLPETDFACLPLRTFLSTLLANVVFKPLLEMFSDPDFLNLQIARLCPKEPPVEFLLKLLRCSSDFSELRACRQFITKEMDLKFKDSATNPELSSLKYTQKLIDLRLSYLQNHRSGKSDKDKPISNMPILSLDELLNKEIALSYYLDYLSILNLQKYVIFYLTAQEWKLTFSRSMLDLQANKTKTSRDELLKSLRDKAQNIFTEYLLPTSSNCLNIDHGLIEALTIKLKDQTLSPEQMWFDSICKFVYEKLKNEEIFLTNFYQSSAYKKLLLELEFCGQNTEHIDLESNTTQLDTGSDSNSGDLQYEDDADDDEHFATTDKRPSIENNIIGAAFDLSVLPMFKSCAIDGNGLLDVGFKHSRSHSDCTGITQTMADIKVNSFHQEAKDTDRKVDTKHLPAVDASDNDSNIVKVDLSSLDKISAKIINTAIHCEGQYAVYAIQVSVVEDNQQKCWHIYRRYSRFLELKKILVKKYPTMSRVPFPAKKAFQNTQRSVLEHRMAVLNDFLRVICAHAETTDEIFNIMRDFVEPDTNDRKISGGTVIRTIETLVNPIKSGMRTIKNMPDTLVGGIAKIFLGKGPMKEASFLDVAPIHLEQSSEYPALTSALNLLDEVFDLQARSQWLRRGIINRLLGAPWVSHTANKKIIQAAKSLIEVDKIEHLLMVILNNIWPEGKRSSGPAAREDNTKLRTRMASRIALFALLSDDLKHVLGSETTRHGLLNLFQMLQNRKLNLRLMLILLNDVLTTVYQTDSMTQHVTANR